jgi:cob(I)alamin adenosyltransferase
VTKIYTRTGDSGKTGLIGGERVPKSSIRVEAYGTVDELSSLIGVVRSCGLPEEVEVMLRRVQQDLFIIGAMLALPDGIAKASYRVPDLPEDAVGKLEAMIDGIEEKLSPLTHFILPGGSEPSALLHMARSVSRRAERRCVALGEVEDLDSAVIPYLNRLSDLCFVLARYVNHLDSRPEIRANPEME